MNEDSKIWDKVHIDSAQYRAVRLIEALQNCVNVCKQIINNPNTDNRDRIEAAKTLCLSEANIFKIIQEGPVFKMSLPTNPNPIFPTKNQPQLTDGNNETI